MKILYKDLDTADLIFGVLLLGIVALGVVEILKILREAGVL